MFVISFNYTILLENLSKISPSLHYPQFCILVNLIKTNFSINIYHFCHLEQYIIIHLKLNNLKSLKKLKLKASILPYMKLHKFFMKVEITQKFLCSLFLKKDYRKTDKDHSTFMDMVFFILLKIFFLLICF